MPWIKFQTQPTTDDDLCDDYRRPYTYSDQLRSDRDLVGPHTNRELGLMISGKKPLAMLDTSFFKQGWLDTVEEKEWSWCHMIPLRGRPEDTVLVCLPGHEFRFHALARVYANCRTTNTMIPRDHAKIGILLGYTKEQIRAFLDKISYRQAA